MLARSIATTTFVGTLAGAFVGACDFGAQWLWIAQSSDRLNFLWRVISHSAGAGAGLGVLIGLVSAATAKAFASTSERVRRIAPVAVAGALTIPLGLFLANLATSGAAIRASSLRDVGYALVVVGIPLASAIGVWIAKRAATVPVARTTLRYTTALSLLALAYVVAKANQRILPGLYEYAHACLSLCTWYVSSLAILVVRGADWRQPFPRSWLILPIAAVTLCLASLTSLRSTENVRAVLFHPRIPTSRVLMHGVTELQLHARRGRSRQRATGWTPATWNTASVRVGTLPSIQDGNVLLVTIDALRPDHLGTYGYSRAISPRIDELAAKSWVFERAYAAAPHSSQSLVSLHTSNYVHELVELGRPLPRGTLADSFTESGYATAAFFTFSIFHTEGEQLKQYRQSSLGFARADHEEVDAPTVTQRALEQLDAFRADGRSNVFMWLHYFDVHEPYSRSELGTSDIDRYDSEIKYTDAAIGALLDELPSRFPGNWIVAIAADHGDEFREHGGVYHGSTLYDEQIRVPLIIGALGADFQLPPRRIPHAVSMVDVSPTLLGLVGLSPPSEARGSDLRAYALGDVARARPVFGAVRTKRMVLDLPFKLIADVRFDTNELYDLATDPRERENRASADLPRVQSMRGSIYAWLDALGAPVSATGYGDPREIALTRGRLGDRRAVEVLIRIVRDETAPKPQRIEASQLLGKLADTRIADELVAAMSGRDSDVNAEAAIALGRMYDNRARPALRSLVYSAPPAVRTRAGVSLARLRDTEAIPALIDGLQLAGSEYEREEAIRWLGRLRDPRGFEPLAQMLGEFRTRYLVVLALARIGGPNAFDVLVDALSSETHASTRNEIVRSLGVLGDVRAIAILASLIAREPELTSGGETLVRLGALRGSVVAGVDGIAGVTGLSKCHVAPVVHDWDYDGRTWCATTASRWSTEIRVPTREPDRYVLLVRLRRADAAQPVEAILRVGTEPPIRTEVDASFQELRAELSSLPRSRRVRVEIELSDEDARAGIDHVLLVPLTPVSPR